MAASKASDSELIAWRQALPTPRSPGPPLSPALCANSGSASAEEATARSSEWGSPSKSRAAFLRPNGSSRRLRELALPKAADARRARDCQPRDHRGGPNKACEQRRGPTWPAPSSLGDVEQAYSEGLPRLSARSTWRVSARSPWVRMSSTAYVAGASCARGTVRARREPCNASVQHRGGQETCDRARTHGANPEALYAREVASAPADWGTASLRRCALCGARMPSIRYEWLAPARLLNWTPTVVCRDARRDRVPRAASSRTRVQSGSADHARCTGRSSPTSSGSAR